MRYSALWRCLGVVALVDVLAVAFGGFGLAGHGAEVTVAVSAGVFALGWFYSVVRPDERIASLAFGAAYLILFTLAASLLSYMGTSLNRPLLDAHFARADAVLGLDWLSVLTFTDAHPKFGIALRAAYHSSMLQIAALFVVLAATGQHVRLRNFLALFSATGLVTIMVSIALPAAGAFVFYDPPAELRNVVGQAAGIWHLEHFEALRSGAMRTIDLGKIEGLITFPSFHTALAIIIAWAFWRTPYFKLPVAFLTAVVIVSTVPVGGHYFVDVIAGAAIAAACIAVEAHWQTCMNLVSNPLARFGANFAESYRPLAWRRR